MKAPKDTGSRLNEYYITGNYKGFYKTREDKMNLSGSPCTSLTFSNGYKEIISSGLFTEDALEKVFDKIDNYQFSNSRQQYQFKKRVSHVFG